MSDAGASSTSSAQASHPSALPPSVTPQRARRVARVLQVFLAIAAIGLLGAAITARVIWAGESEIAASTAALRRGDAHDATVHARRAAGWYAPGAPHVRVAYERLIAIATAAEGLGDRDLALLAWRGVRTAAFETRWLVVPHAGDLDRANRAIARIEAAAPRPPGTRTEPPQRIEDRQLEALLRDEAPRTPWVVVLLGAFVAWVGGALWSVRRITRGPNGVDLRRGFAGAMVAVVGVFLWVFALWQA